ncbi:MAG: hypothetical protein HOV68_27620 [Streptomycetaceae bacterium]|nr:hypothetical protein [Streptomycetaceae bacterium]
MSDRLTVDTITSDQLDALQLRAARMEHATRQAAELAVRLEDAEAGITAAIRQRKEQESRALRAEAAVQRVTALRDRWVQAGPPPLGTSINRWVDKRLAELNAALDEPKEG